MPKRARKTRSKPPRRPERIRPGRRAALRERRQARDPPAARRHRLHLRRHGRQAHHRPQGARADPEPRHSAGLHRRLDLPVAQRPHPGHRPGRPRPEAVPLPPAVAGGAGRDQVRPDARVQRGAARRSAKRVEQDLARPGLPREKVLATVVRLLECTGIRVGNDEYARANRSFGLTTLQDRHVEISGSKLRFEFRGKSGKVHASRSATGGSPGSWRGARRCRARPVPVRGRRGRPPVGRLGRRERLSAGDHGGGVHRQGLPHLGGDDAGGRRRWRSSAPRMAEREAKAAILQAIDQVAERLNNTRAVCRKYYVHPAVLETYEAGTLHEALARKRRRPPRRRRPGSRPRSRPWSGSSGRSNRRSPNIRGPGIPHHCHCRHHRTSPAAAVTVTVPRIAAWRAVDGAVVGKVPARVKVRFEGPLALLPEVTSSSNVTLCTVPPAAQIQVTVAAVLDPERRGREEVVSDRHLIVLPAPVPGPVAPVVTPAGQSGDSTRRQDRTSHQPWHLLRKTVQTVIPTIVP